jgi:hypothetical protein
MPLLDGYQVSKGEYPYSEVYVCCAVLSMEKSTILFSLLMKESVMQRRHIPQSSMTGLHDAFLTLHSQTRYSPIRHYGYAVWSQPSKER